MLSCCTPTIVKRYLSLKFIAPTAHGFFGEQIDTKRPSARVDESGFEPTPTKEPHPSARTVSHGHRESRAELEDYPRERATRRNMPTSALEPDAATAPSARCTEVMRRIAEGDLPWGSAHSDHMLVATWTQAGGWGPGEIIRFQPLQLSPCTSVLHYGMSVFEGMKAFVDAEAMHVVRLFRPWFHARRLNLSAARLALPTYDEQELVTGVAKLVQMEQALGWIPVGRGASLYVRPVLFASEDGIGVRKSNEAMLVVTCHPVGSYFRGGIAKPIRLLADCKHVRAFRGGVGFAKTAGNYAASMQPAEEAMQRGFDQILWTDGTADHMIGECGQMNFFWVERRPLTDEHILVTPALDGTILPGATRDCVLALAVQLNIVQRVEEKTVPLSMLMDGIRTGTVIEMFGTGTGATLVPVQSITVNGEECAIIATEIALDAGGRLRDALLNVYHTEHDWTCDINRELVRPNVD
jgi:branched-chain amino acid aminotransferase